MSYTKTEYRSVFVPFLVILGSAALLIFAALFLRAPGGSQTMVLAAPEESPSHTTNVPRLRPTAVPPVGADPAMAAAEEQLVRNMAHFDSRFERYEAELFLEEEKALSRSDLVGTRYQIRTLQEDLVALKTLSEDWTTLREELLTGVVGRQIAGSPELVQEFVAAQDDEMLSERDILELTERLEPLSDFVRMLEDQDRIAYQPSERFETRLTTMVRNVEKSAEDYRHALSEFRRLEREAELLPPGNETLHDAVYRLHRAAAQAAAERPSDSPRYRDDTVLPPEVDDGSPDLVPTPVPAGGEQSEDSRSEVAMPGPQPPTGRSGDSHDPFPDDPAPPIRPDEEGNHILTRMQDQKRTSAKMCWPNQQLKVGSVICPPPRCRCGRKGR